MASFEVKLAWSVQVPVEILGAHLQACVNLRPVINTIRLCNRFGRGPLAAIAKLPVELVTQIESYLIGAEREQEKKEWVQDFRCHQGLCKPMDHFKPKECVEAWCDAFEDCFHCGGCGCDMDERRQTMQELNDNQLTALKEYFDNESFDVSPEETLWWNNHVKKVDQWMEKTGQPTSPGHGLLSKHASMLLHNFGLSLWATHTQLKKGKAGQFAQAGILKSTIAYLVLPCNKHTENFERGVCEDRGMPYVDTKSGGAVPVIMPGDLSEKNIGRFERALTVLDLDPICEPETKAPIYAYAQDWLDWKTPVGVEKKAKAAVKGKKDCAPKLKVLYSHSISEHF